MVWYLWFGYCEMLFLGFSEMLLFVHSMANSTLIGLIGLIFNHLLVISCVEK